MPGRINADGESIISEIYDVNRPAHVKTWAVNDNSLVNVHRTVKP